jgi:hypothetical protein
MAWCSRVGLTTAAVLAGVGLASCGDTRRNFDSAEAGGAGGSSGSGESGAAGDSAGGAPARSCNKDAECDDGESCCGGECTDTTSDASNCGECGVTCKAAHGEAACSNSQCTITRCDDGFVDCGGYKDGCETLDQGPPGAPNPVSPMVGAYTGAVNAESSLRPKFRWKAPEELGSCGTVTYEIELSRECKPGKLEDCAFDDPDVRETGLEGTEWTPDAPLPVSETVPVGALYAWRVRACDGPERCSEWSRVSYVNVGRLIDDVNADGYSDLVELDERGEEVLGTVYNGDGVTPLAFSAHFGTKMSNLDQGRFLGDVNGDGFPDMLLWSSYLSDPEPPLVVLGAATPEEFVYVPLSAALPTHHRGGRAGDLDGDGFADVAISEFEQVGDSATPVGVVRLYRGRADFSLASPVNVLPPENTSASQFGAALAGGLDANGDGYPDLFVLDDDEGLIHVIRGDRRFPKSIAGSIEAPDLVTVSLDSELLDAGDRNGDGYDELAAYVRTIDAMPDQAVIQVFLGGVELPSGPLADVVIDVTAGLAWGGGYDLGDDGLADLVFDTSWDNVAARALPGTSEAQSTSDLVFIGSLQDYTAIALGDYDGDGATDLMVHHVSQSYHHLFRRPGEGPSLENCSQPEASFSLVGDWCSAESIPFSAPAANEGYYHGAPVR